MSQRQSGTGSQRQSARASAAQEDAGEENAGAPDDAPEEDLEQGPDPQAEEGGASMDGEMAAEEEGDGGDQTPLIIGVTVALLVLVGVLGYWFCCCGDWREEYQKHCKDTFDAALCKAACERGGNDEIAKACIGIMDANKESKNPICPDLKHPDDSTSTHGTQKSF